MSLGTLTSISASAAVGPMFFDNVSILGESSYLAGGTTGLLAKLRAARLDSRTIVSAQCYGNAGYCVEYDAATDKIKVSVADDGGQADEVADATNLSAVAFKFSITSK